MLQSSLRTRSAAKKLAAIRTKMIGNVTSNPRSPPGTPPGTPNASPPGSPRIGAAKPVNAFEISPDSLNTDTNENQDRAFEYV